MSTPEAQRFLELLDILDQDPDLQKELHRRLIRLIHNNDELRQDLRKEILLEELINLPQRFAELVATVSDLTAEFRALAQATDRRLAALESDVAELKNDMTEIKTVQSRMSGQLSHLMGTDYETTAIERARRMTRRSLDMEQATLWHTGQRSTLTTFEKDVLIPAIRENRISRRQADDLEDADCIIRCENPDGEVIAAVVEISVTIQDHDHNRAVRRAEILELATGLPTRAYVIGQSEDESVLQSDGAAFLQYTPDQWNDQRRD